jgi:hypothetical protein
MLPLARPLDPLLPGDENSSPSRLIPYADELVADGFREVGLRVERWV